MHNMGFVSSPLDGLHCKTANTQVLNTLLALPILSDKIDRNAVERQKGMHFHNILPCGEDVIANFITKYSDKM